MSFKKQISKSLPLTILSIAASNAQMAFASPAKVLDYGVCGSAPFQAGDEQIRLKLTFQSRLETNSDGTKQELLVALHEFVDSSGKHVQDPDLRPYLTLANVREDGTIELWRRPTSGNITRPTLIKGVDVKNLNTNQTGTLEPGSELGMLDYFYKGNDISVDCKFIKNIE